MAILTLTTDFGDVDYYVGALKGYILSTCPDITLTDISHNVIPFDIFHAAFVVKNSFHHFPEDSIHLVHVESANIAKRRYILVRYAGHWLAGSDNGLFSMVFEERPEAIYAIQQKPDMVTTFPGRDILANACCRLINGDAPDDFAQPMQGIRELSPLRATVFEQNIRATVVYIDHYGNAIVNIQLDLFNEIREERRFTISFARREFFDQLSSHYSDVPEGEKVCFFNAAGYLEIAINMGDAAGLFGMAVGDSVQIDFQSA